MKTLRDIVSIDREKCNGCGECVKACAEGAIELADGKARLIAENYCDGLAACLGECPQGAISIVKREAQAFDLEAVEGHLANKRRTEPEILNTNSNSQVVLPCGCPSTQVKMFEKPDAKDPSLEISQGKTGSKARERQQSSLTHWPVQIKLIPPTAPFLKNADLLVASDCTPLAYPDFHADFLKGKVVMMGCPKFDDTEEYIEKFVDIFGIAHIKSITIIIMEVPCCSKMPLIVQKAMELAGKKIPTKVVVISPRGMVLQQGPLAA
ncbi:MAG TPA: 4Fe-4S binding protein [Syntrophorhabdaceae bacterium]|nr:4Fe-4S binding protein [Syntrophorhabdaceae bacterium]